MIKYLLLFFVFITIQKNTEAQNVPSAFTLEGKINAQQGKIILVPIGLSFYHPGYNSIHEIK
jgi:hypothetical protein